MGLQLGISFDVGKIPPEQSIVKWIGEIKIEHDGAVEQYVLIIEPTNKKPGFLLKRRDVKGNTELLVREDF